MAKTWRSRRSSGPSGMFAVAPSVGVTAGSGRREAGLADGELPRPRAYQNIIGGAPRGRKR